MAKEIAAIPALSPQESRDIKAVVGKLGEACDNPNGLLVLDSAEAKALRRLILHLRQQIPNSENRTV
jgi:hypothetical protein